MGSTSLSAQYQLSKTFSLGSSYAYTERAPTFYELFANGPHAATGAYEAGNAEFSKERSNAIDLALRWKDGESNARVGVFVQQFRNYIALKRTGIDRDAAGNIATDCGDSTSRESDCREELLPEFRYSQINARLSGFEAEGKFRLIDAPYTIDVEGKIDYVRAQDRTDNDPLPRITPLRVTGGIIWASGPFGARFDVQNAAKQNRFSRDDAIGATDGYTLVNVAATYSFDFARVRGLLYIRGANLGDRKAFNAASFDTIRALAPLPGRSVRAGVQINF
jgi:iron complex outermembrane receptor protein